MDLSHQLTVSNKTYKYYQSWVDSVFGINNIPIVFEPENDVCMAAFVNVDIYKRLPLRDQIQTHYLLGVINGFSQIIDFPKKYENLSE